MSDLLSYVYEEDDERPSAGNVRNVVAVCNFRNIRNVGCICNVGDACNVCNVGDVRDACL